RHRRAGACRRQGRRACRRAAGCVRPGPEQGDGAYARRDDSGRAARARHAPGEMRLDKWLWAARFFKTRSLAQQAIAAGRVKLGDVRVKASHLVKPVDSLAIRIGDFEWHIVVKALSDKRGPAEQ